jgi:cob(I)alamin adenosyltransferase
VVCLADLPGESVSEHVVAYLNRLSDLLFVLARSANNAEGQDDVPWEKKTM